MRHKCWQSDAEVTCCHSANRSDCKLYVDSWILRDNMTTDITIYMINQQVFIYLHFRALHARPLNVTLFTTATTLSFNCIHFLSGTHNCQRECCLSIVRSIKIVSSFPLFFAHAITLDILLCHVSTSHLVITPQSLSFMRLRPRFILY